MAPLVAIVFSFLAQGALTSHEGPSKRWGLIIVGGMACLLILAGFVLGILALCGMARHGREGIFGQALTGTLLCGVIIIFDIAAIPALNRARKQAAANAKMQEAARELNQEAQRQLEGGSDPAQTSEKIQQLQKTLLDASQNVGDDASKVMRATSAYADKFNKYQSDYNSAVKIFQNAKVLSAANLTNKAVLAARREAVQGFLDANAKLKDLIVHGAENYRAELDRLHTSQSLADQAMAGYHKRADVMNPLVVSIREKDDNIGQAMLGIIDLEEADWGHWSISQTSGKIRFEDATQAQAYNARLKEIRDASAEQAQLQQKLLSATRPTQ